MKNIISQEQVKHVADLAKLKLSAEEVIKFQKQLADILKYISILKEIQTDKIEVTSQVTGLKNIFHQDKKPAASFSVKESLSNTSSNFNNYFKTKGIFEK